MRIADLVYDREVLRVAVPESFRERFMGLRRRTGAMLFRTSSVHGFGMDRALTVVVIDRDRTVREVRRLMPGRIVVAPGAHWLLEMEEGDTAPPVGVRLDLYSPPDERSPRRVRNSDRQPRRHLGASRRHAG
ncbi:MAG: hypothetical protein ACLGHX_11425 [Acidimicrobiia bacterium]